MADANNLPAVPDYAPPLEKVVLRKVAWRLLPFLFMLYVLNILDRVNIGFASLQMQEDLRLSETVFSLGAGIFFIGYFLFEVPSNLIMHRVGARRWIGRIVISWGLISASMMFVREAWHFYALRFLLGLAEAGFFPGIILYLSYWFPARERARAVALFMTASPVSGILGSPLSGALLELSGKGGMMGWHWLFVVEGLPTAVLGIFVWFLLTDRPAKATWLTPVEREWLTARMNREEEHRAEHHGLSGLGALANPSVVLLTLLYFTIATCGNTFGFYLPKIIKGHFPGRSNFEIGLLTAIPSMATVIAMVLNSIHSDRTGERRWHVALAALVGASGWTMAAVVKEPWQVLVGMSLAQMGVMSMVPAFWSLPTAFLSGAAAAGGIAMINSFGNLGGFFGPQAMGYFNARTGTFQGGMLTLAVLLIVGAGLALCVPHDRRAELAARKSNKDSGDPEPRFSEAAGDPA